MGDLVIEMRIATLIALRRPARPSSSANLPINHPIPQSPNHPIVRSPQGFTMIELLIVMALIAILASMGMAQYHASVVYAKEATLREDLFQMRDAIDQYYADKGQYPGTIDALVSEHYMRAVPVDPFTKSNSSWQTIPAEPDPNNPTAEPGVYDVKSGSDANALDGSRYADW